jgi:hypothetical protein
MMLEGIIPAASRFRQIDTIALPIKARDHRAEYTFRARVQQQRVRSRTQCRPLIVITNAREPRIDVQHGQAYHGRTRTQTTQANSTNCAGLASRFGGGS